MVSIAHGQTLQHPAAVETYIRKGWKLVPIPPGTKGPEHKGWNLPGNHLKKHNDLPPNWGIGLAHAYSGTMALDIDEWDRAVTEFRKHNIDLDALYAAPDAVVIDSGKQGHGKLLYRMPEGVVLPSKKLIDTAPDGQKYNYIDFRCASSTGNTVQDVLPPSIHPETMQPYRWAGLGRWENLPEIPQSLLNFWKSLLESETPRDTTPVNPDSIDFKEVNKALQFVTPDCEYDEWYRVGMALHHAGIVTGKNELAFKIWDSWSALGQKYPGGSKLITHWQSFKQDGTVTLGTLFDYAFEGGYERPKVDASHLFSNTETGETEKPLVNPMDVLLPPSPSIDISVFPEVLRTRSTEVSEHIGCDPIVPLFAGLAAVCGAVDARTRVELVEGFKVAPVLWLMTIGDPADKKSPGSKPMLAPLMNIEREDRPNFKKRLLEWEGLEAARSAAHKNFLDHASNPENILSNDIPPSVPELPPKPEPKKIVVSDITSQKLVRHAENRPEGLLCHLDEMSSWIDKMNDKRSGEDRSAWVQAFEADRYVMDRVTAGSIEVDHFAVSIYGNIQPMVLKDQFTKLSSDGMVQRFIPAVLRSELTRLGNPVPESMTSAPRWEQTLRNISALPPITYKLAPETYRVFRAFQQWYEQQKFHERIVKSHPAFMTAFGKIEGQVGRIALVFHLLTDPFDSYIRLNTLERAIQFMRGYCIPSIRHAFGDVGGLIENSLDHYLMEYVIFRSHEETVCLRDIKHSARRIFDRMGIPSTRDKTQLVREAMITLEQCHWVTVLEERRNTTIWAINPELRETFKDMRERVIKSKQAIRDSINKGLDRDRDYVAGYDPETMDSSE